MDKNKMKTVLCTLVTAFLCSCAAPDSGLVQTGRYEIYRPSKSQHEVFDVREETESGDGDTIEFLYRELTTETDEYYSPIPKGTRLLSYTQRDGELILYLSGEYSEESGYARVLSDYCLTRTYCGISGVETVGIYSGAKLIATGMRPDDAVYEDNILPSGFWRLRLFYPDEYGECLRYEYAEVEEDTSTLERRVMELLRAGPKGSGMVSALPEHLEVFSVSTDKFGVCTVNLSVGFYENLPETEMAEKLRIYSIVNSLCSLSWVKSVQFLVDGRAVEVYAFMSLAEPLEKNDDIVWTASYSEKQRIKEA